MFFPLHLGPEPPPPGDRDDEKRHGPRPDRPEGDEPGVILHTISMIEKLQRKAFGLVFGEQGLHPAQGVCLKTISQNEGLSQRELADELRIERATASVMLQKMEKSGIITREPDASDQRVSRIFLTEKGKTANRLTDDGCRDFITGCLESFSDEQRDQLLEMLRTIEDYTLKFVDEFEKEEFRPQSECKM